MAVIPVIVESVWTTQINVMLMPEIAVVCVGLVQLCHPLVLVSKKLVRLLLVSPSL